jgi:hypothetical protein
MFRSRKYYLKGKELGKEYINRETGHEEFMDEFFDYLSLVDTPTQWKDTMKGFVGVLLNKRRYAKVRKKDEETSELQRQKVFAEVSKYKPGDCFKSRDIADVTGLSRGSVGLILGMYKNLLNLTHFYKTCVWKKEPEKKLTKSEILKLKLRNSSGMKELKQ